MGYWNDCIISTKGDLIALSLVESIREAGDDAEDRIVNKLKGDTVLLVRTVSGQQHTVSMLYTQQQMPDQFEDQVLDEMARKIVRRWQYIQAGEQ
jgi:hypothetical protein